MPIRFRCPHCQQLLGIARRKAGTPVECPTCHASVLVPGSDQLDAPPLPSGGPARPPLPPTAPVPAPGPGEEPLFERSDFDQLFAPPGEEQPKPPPPPANLPALELFPVTNGPKPIPVPGGYSHSGPSVSSAADWEGPPGYLLTPRRASLLTVLVILLMALAFVGGLLVGRYLL